MSNRTIEAVMRLSAKLGPMGAFGQLAGKLNAVNQKALAFNRTQTAMARAQNAMNGLMASSAARYLGPAVIGYGALTATKEYAALERQLTRTGLKIGANRQEMAALNQNSMAIAQKYAVSNDAVVETLDAYAETGAEIKDIKSDLDGLVKVQQAMGAAGKDVVNTWDAARKSFGLMSKDSERFFDIIAAGGAGGKFEGSDLAQYLPSLMPRAAVHGLGGLSGTGSLVGALEAMRDRTGTSENAAVSVGDFLDKINSPTVQRNFKKFNIDLPKALKDARKNGDDLFDTMAKLITKATKGDATKLGHLFSEQDSRNFALLLMQDLDRLHDKINLVRDESAGMVSNNVNAVLADADAKMTHLANSWDRIVKSAGAAVVDLGGAKAMDNISTDIDRFFAARKGGWSPLDSLKAFFTGGDPSKVVDEYAYIGGRRSEAERRAEEARQQYSDSRRAGEQTREPTYGASIVNGVPVPVKNDPNAFSVYSPLMPFTGVPPDLMSRGDKAAARGRILDRGADANYSEFISAAQAGSEQLKQAGTETGDSIKEGADTLSQVAGQLKAALDSGAASIASAIRATLPSDLSRPIGSLKGVRADTGRTNAGLGIGSN